MWRRVILSMALVLTVAQFTGTVSAAPIDSASVNQCVPTITSTGWGDGIGPDHVGWGINYVASCPAKARIVFQVLDANGNLVDQQTLHAYTLSTTGEQLSAAWSFPQGTSGTYTLTNTIYSNNGKDVWLPSPTDWTVTLLP